FPCALSKSGNEHHLFQTYPWMKFRRHHDAARQTQCTQPHEVMKCVNSASIMVLPMPAFRGNLIRKTTTSPAFVGSPTRVAIWTPLGKAGFSFHVSASGVTRVGVSCAIAGSENATTPATRYDTPRWCGRLLRCRISIRPMTAVGHNR